MAGNIKGLTVEIGGDTTKLGQALDDVNSRSKMLSKELGAINNLLKVDPGNYEAMAQKQQILAEAVENTKQKLDILKEAEQQVQAQFERGEVSEEQVSALRNEIINTTAKLKTYEKAAEETADAMGQMGDGAEDASDSLDDTGDEADKAADKVEDFSEAADDAEETGGKLGSTLSSAAKSGLSAVGSAASGAVGKIKELKESLGESLANAAKTGLTAVGAAATAAVAGLTAAAEESREYREAMGKLNTAFETSGHSAEDAYNTYSSLQSILGETDQAVEAANHLAKLTDNAEELTTWTDIATGVYATFGDSLPIEGLTEAANETAKVGQITGPMADAINWPPHPQRRGIRPLAGMTKP